MNEDYPKVLVFRKQQAGRELFCRVEIFDDGSAYVDGDDDEIEGIFEESADAFLEAIAHVEKHGYARIEASDIGG